MTIQQIVDLFLHLLVSEHAVAMGRLFCDDSCLKQQQSTASVLNCPIQSNKTKQVGSTDKIKPCNDLFFNGVFRV